MSFVQMQCSGVSRTTTSIARRLGSGSVPESDSTPVAAGVRIEERRLTPAAALPSGGDCLLAGTRTLCVSGRRRLRRWCSQAPRTAPRTGATR